MRIAVVLSCASALAATVPAAAQDRISDAQRSQLKQLAGQIDRQARLLDNTARTYAPGEADLKARLDDLEEFKDAAKNLAEEADDDYDDVQQALRRYSQRWNAVRPVLTGRRNGGDVFDRYVRFFDQGGQQLQTLLGGGVRSYDAGYQGGSYGGGGYGGDAADRASALRQAIYDLAYAVQDRLKGDAYYDPLRTAIGEAGKAADAALNLARRGGADAQVQSSVQNFAAHWGRVSSYLGRVDDRVVRDRTGDVADALSRIQQSRSNYSPGYGGGNGYGGGGFPGLLGGGRPRGDDYFGLLDDLTERFDRLGRQVQLRDLARLERAPEAVGDYQRLADLADRISQGRRYGGRGSFPYPLVEQFAQGWRPLAGELRRLSDRDVAEAVREVDEALELLSRSTTFDSRR